MRIEISKIKPNTDNPRTISKDKFPKLVQSIKDFPDMLEKRPLVVDEDFVVLGGNMRLKALQQLGHKEATVIVAKGWTEEQKREFIIKDNVGFGDWDWDILANEWSDEPLTDWGLDVWEPDLDPQTGNTDPDDVPDAPKVPITKLGDLYILGAHKLLCGDATSDKDLAKLCDGEQVDMWLTDPPYNVDYEGKTKDALKIENDNKSDLDFRKFLVDSYSAANKVMKEGAAFYIWHADSEGYNFRGAAQDIGWRIRQCLIWKKSSMVMGRQDYHWKHEPCLYGWKEGAAHLWSSDRKQTTIMEFDRPSRNAEHPTMKPVEIFEYLMLNNTKNNSIVLDTFAGSGTTVIACERNKRKARVMELDPIYCDVIVKRWEEYTGQKATKNSL